MRGTEYLDVTEKTLTAAVWEGPRPAALDVARLLAAWLVSVVTRRPMAMVESEALLWFIVTITPEAQEK